MPVLPRKRFGPYRHDALKAAVGGPLTPLNPGVLAWRAPNLSGHDHWRGVALTQNSVVSIALAWVRRNAIKGRLVCGTESAHGTFEEAAGYPLTELLRRPNRLDSWRATLGGTADSLAVDGYAYWLKERNRLGEVVGVWWQPNLTITPEEEPDPARQLASGPLKGYWYDNGRTRRWYEPSEVVHFRQGRDPLCRWQGISDLKVQIRNVAGIDAAERYTAAVLRNAHAGKALAPKDKDAYIDAGSLDEKSMQALADDLETGLSGENAGRVRKLRLAVDVVDLGFGPQEMALTEILDLPIALILAALGLNAITLTLPGGNAISTFANKENADRHAFNNAVIPLQDLIADEIEQQLLPDFAADAPADSVWWDRKDVEELREDANDRMARARQLRPDGPLGSLNEARTLVDMPPVEGGDTTPVEEEEAAKEEAERLRQEEAGAWAEDDGSDTWAEDTWEDDESKALKARGARRKPRRSGPPKGGKPGRSPRDGDGDGRIHDGTADERPVPPKARSEKREVTLHVGGTAIHARVPVRRDERGTRYGKPYDGGPETRGADRPLPPALDAALEARAARPRAFRSEPVPTADGEFTVRAYRNPYHRWLTEERKYRVGLFDAQGRLDYSEATNKRENLDKLMARLRRQAKG